MRLEHSLAPVYNEHSRVLILGSFPSVKSRESNFFYGHPQNRFWLTLANVMGDGIPVDIAQKKEFLLRHQIALWDVIRECDIDGSNDSTIRNVLPNDLGCILNCAHIGTIFTNGSVADQLYRRYLLPQTGIPAVRLPSTSPANAGYSPDRLAERWQIVRTAASTPQ